MKKEKPQADFKVYVINDHPSSGKWVEVGEAFRVAELGSEEIFIEISAVVESIRGKHLILSNRTTRKIPIKDYICMPAETTKKPRLKLVKS